MYNARTNKKDIWNPHFYKSFPGFADIATIWEPCLDRFLNDWPNIAGYRWIANHAYDFVADHPDIQYEHSIYYQGQIPTRNHSWHDFFNNLTWIRWPKIKHAILKKSIESAQLKGARTTIQNTLAHFD